MKRLSLAILLLAALVSCIKNPDTPEEQPDDKPSNPENVVGPISVEAVLSETIAASLPAWAEGDAISVFGAGSTHRRLTLEKRDGASATFSGDGDSLGPYYALWPYSEGNSLSGGALSGTVPAEQKLAGGAIAPGALCAVARSEDKKLSFKNVCGLLEIKVKETGVSLIMVQTADGSPLAGRFSANPDSGEISKVEGGSDAVTLRPAGSAFEPGTYYISCLPFKKGSLRIAAERSSIRKAVSEKADAELGRSAALSLGELSGDNVQWAYLIGSYDELKAWVADKANWNPSGETVTLTADIDMKDELWTPLTDSYPGVFDGAGHCISHIKIESSELAHLGFFGKGYAKEIRNLTLGSADGRTYDGTSHITSSYTTSSTSSYWCYTAPVTLPGADIVNLTNFIPVTVTSKANRSSRAGGIAAWITGTVHINGCRNYGTVTVEDHAITSGSSYKYLAAGGILGGQNTESSDVTVTDCHNFGKVTSSNHCSYGLGGIVGVIYSTAKQLTIDGCTNEGEVELLYTATQNDLFTAGGIIGKVACKAGATLPSIRNCTNKGRIYSEAVHQHHVGGIAGLAEGVSITSCRNEGAVEIDHSRNASTRFQNIGGILGAAMSGGGANELKDNVNSGSVTMHAASSGHNKTPSASTTFYGVNAGGIVGMAGGVTALTGNSNDGTVLAENAFQASNADYPATVHAGGILGYDYGAIDKIAENRFSGTLSAKTTKATTVPSQVYAGGVVGRLRAATMLSGSGKGSVNTSAADAGALQYAGSIAGWCDGTIAGCEYGGTVNGQPANESNTVGGGAAGQPGGGDQPQGGTFGVSETEVNFPGSAFSQHLLTMSAGSKDVSISLSDLDWLKTESIPSTVAAGTAVSISLIPRTGNVDELRRGTLTATENGGGALSVSISQSDLYTPVYGFPARWEIEKGVTYTEGNAAGRRWLNEGVAETVAAGDSYSKAPGCGYISAGSTTGGKLVYSVAPSGTQNLSIGNMGEGDYIQFSVPVTTLPAGTDVDFMLTINTNNNKTPKYWLFEYWDDGRWNAQPRYIASEDGSTQYSFDVYDFDSKNHRTYITTFRLSKAVNGEFVKMRVRAVGKVNCSGTTLVRTANAYMNLPCMTYHSCVINAYPGVEAKEAVPVKLLQLGNSFTYYHGSAFKLKQICRAEGHATDVRINVKGSQEFAEHLNVLPFSQRLIAEGGYDKAIIQDGSYYHAEYAAGSKSAIQGVDAEYTPEEILEYTKLLSAAIKDKSPQAGVILESVWSYPYKTLGNFLGFGSYEKFDEMQWKGSTAIAEADPNIDEVSPIGKAFALARSSEYGITGAYNYLLYTDNFHPHRYGSYLKACVNYLMLFREPFGAHPADCDIPAADAARLREIAEKIVLGDNCIQIMLNNQKL